MRLVLLNPIGLEVEAADFSDTRLREAFEALSPQREATKSGVPLDPGRVGEPGTQGILRSLALDSRPLPDATECAASGSATKGGGTYRRRVEAKLARDWSRAQSRPFSNPAPS